MRFHVETGSWEWYIESGAEKIFKIVRKVKEDEFVKSQNLDGKVKSSICKARKT